MQVFGHLFIISAPSGAGKTSLVKALLANDAQLKLSISHTTRAARPGETHGVDYHFVNEAEFLTMLNAGQFLESAHVHGARYGTARSSVDIALQTGFDVILEIDWQGAEQVRQLFPEAIGIFILPPSVDSLAMRLQGRGQDGAEIIQKRLAAARSEMRHVRAYDYVTINDNFDVALQDITAVIRSQRLTVSSQLQRHVALINALT